MFAWLYLLGAIASEVAATLSLRAAKDAPWFYAIVVTGYLAAFTLLSLVLREGTALGVAYGIWCAAGVATVAAVSHYLFRDPLTPLMGLGIALIMGGVLLVELGQAH